MASLFAFMTSWLTPASLFLLLNIMIATIALATRFGSHNKPQQQNPQIVRAPSLLDRVKSIDFSLYKFHPHDPQPETETTSYYYHTTEPEYTTRIERAPSLLERVKSINFSHLYRSESGTDFSARPETDLQTDTGHGFEDQPKIERAPSLLERVKSIKFPSFKRSELESGELDSHTGTGHNLGSNMDHHVKRSKSEPKETPKRQVLGKMMKSASEREMLIDREEEEEEQEELVERRRPATTRVDKTVLDDEVDAKADDFINRFKQQLKLQRLDSLLRYKEVLKGKQKI